MVIEIASSELESTQIYYVQSLALNRHFTILVWKGLERTIIEFAERHKFLSLTLMSSYLQLVTCIMLTGINMPGYWQCSNYF